MPEQAMHVALGVVVGGASLLAVAGHRFHRSDTLPSLEGWALAGRTLGPGWTWLLLGGTVFTAYTFTAVPGLVYGSGAAGFFALPYTVIVCPLAFVLLPRLWTLARSHGYVTVADLVRGRYGSPPLALAVAVTGILATLPYLALQLLGIRAVLTVAGLYPHGTVGDLAMITLFAVPAAATHCHGLRAPTLVSALKALVVFGSAGTAIALALGRLGGPGALFAAASRQLSGTGAPGASLTLAPHQQGAFVTLALGSALALLMYPHVLTAGFAASGPDTLRRAAIGLPAWTGVLGLFGLLGIAALAAGIRTPPGRAEAAVPLLVDVLMPAAPAGLVLGALTVGALVPAAVMSIATASLFVRNVYVEYLRPTATPKRQLRIARRVSLVATAGAVAFVLGLRNQDAVNLQLLGGVWILQICPAVIGGLFTRRLHQRALLAGWATGMAAGTVTVATRGFSSVMPFPLGGHDLEVSTGLVALSLNLAVAVVLTTVLDRLGTPRGADTTAPPPRLALRRRPERGTSST
ncbi:sodium:solute symporter [Streptomyces sp. NPDC002055]|uniref:sodium:solute symporter family protein n=1 Tax=Streptomyces sp. NPDC002055 TaxID=3154534 RepID=UPI00331A66DD